ncbi:unnamed protein product [Spirodela intermedia]|uniref:Uncharacterized protein n=2 Tax=Spirodela intermedia TaxID=51605 RepID=A0A7I8ICN2_SPIIN|nr:unnamed protein product [Spirodela intermedia]CAA6655516.1 unnamed protein product [Spirodela intermedia]CAA7390804.1 unnamed protein product [Spirodela intermedia]
MTSTMAPKISDTHFEALGVDQKRMVEDMQKNMQQFQLTICMRLKALEKKEQLNLQPTSNCQPAPPES